MKQQQQQQHTVDVKGGQGLRDAQNKCSAAGQIQMSVQHNLCSSACPCRAKTRFLASALKGTWPEEDCAMDPILAEFMRSTDRARSARYSLLADRTAGWAAVCTFLPSCMACATLWATKAEFLARTRTVRLPW